MTEYERIKEQRDEARAEIARLLKLFGEARWRWAKDDKTEDIPF